MEARLLLSARGAGGESSGRPRPPSLPVAPVCPKTVPLRCRMESPRESLTAALAVIACLLACREWNRLVIEVTSLTQWRVSQGRLTW